MIYSMIDSMIFKWIPSAYFCIVSPLKTKNVDCYMCHVIFFSINGQFNFYHMILTAFNMLFSISWFMDPDCLEADTAKLLPEDYYCPLVLVLTQIFSLYTSLAIGVLEIICPDPPCAKCCCDSVTIYSKIKRPSIYSVKLARKEILTKRINRHWIWFETRVRHWIKAIILNESLTLYAIK